MNDPSAFGGVKESGWGREVGEEGVLLYTETKTSHSSAGRLKISAAATIAAYIKQLNWEEYEEVEGTAVFGELAYIMAASPALAEDDKTQAAPVNSPEILVTANKRQENINKVGLTITAVSGAQLAERKVTSLEDVASLVPGLAYSPSTANTPIFTLRGVGFNESSLASIRSQRLYRSGTAFLPRARQPFRL
jgi:hypothetical protein